MIILLQSLEQNLSEQENREQSTKVWPWNNLLTLHSERMKLDLNLGSLNVKA